MLKETTTPKTISYISYRTDALLSVGNLVQRRTYNTLHDHGMVHKAVTNSSIRSARCKDSMQKVIKQIDHTWLIREEAKRQSQTDN